MKPMIRSEESLIVVDPKLADYEPLLAHFPLTWCASGEDALRIIGQPSQTLWLINVRLPDISGIGLLKLVRTRPFQRSIFLVGDAYSVEDEVAARLAGANAYLCKPVSVSWLNGHLPHCRPPSIRAGPAPFY